MYTIAVLLFAAAIFSKESLLTIIVIYPLAAWLATDMPKSRMLRRLALSMVPFALVLGVNAGIRLLSWGHLGGYGRNRIDYSTLPPIIWDQLLAYMRVLLSPLNSTIFGAAASQVAGVGMAVLLLLGVARYGRMEYRALARGAGCLAVFLVPVLILPIGTTDLQNNRFTYLPALGYCVIIAALLNGVITELIRSRNGRVLALALPLVVAMLVTWVQLVPWYVAGVQARDLDDTLARLMPIEPRGQPIEWYVQNPPDNYRGAYVDRLGIGTLRYFQGGSRPDVHPIENARNAPLALAYDDAFALNFAYDQGKERFYVEYGAGITSPSHDSPSSRAELRWDFRDCDQAALDAWRAAGANSRCVRGEGLRLEPEGNDPQLVAPDIGMRLPNSGGRYLHLRAQMSVQADQSPGWVFAQWFWLHQGTTWAETESGTVPLSTTGESVVYWLFVPFGPGDPGVAGLRFDPVNSDQPVTIGWMAAAEVP